MLASAIPRYLAVCSRSSAAARSSVNSSEKTIEPFLIVVVRGKLIPLLASAHCSINAPPPKYAETQPWPPHRHLRPPGTSVVCPHSPAVQVAPW